MICYQCLIDKNGVSSTENKVFTVQKGFSQVAGYDVTNMKKHLRNEIYLFSIAISIEN